MIRTKLKKHKTGKVGLDISSLKMIIIDEADFFFGDAKNFYEMNDLHKNSFD